MISSLEKRRKMMDSFLTIKNLICTREDYWERDWKTGEKRPRDSSKIELIIPIFDSMKEVYSVCSKLQIDNQK